MKKLSILFVMILCMTMIVSANPPKNGRYEDSNGNLYIYKNGKVQTGYFRYKGDTYYGHKKGTKAHPRGSLTRYQFRIRSGNRWYGFDWQGKMYKKDYYRRTGRFKRSLVLKIRKNHTVKYIYTNTSTRRGCRYSTAELRYQRDVGFNDWRTVEGMQFVPDGWVDTQR